MASVAPVRRNNNRKASPPEGYEYDSSKQSNGAVLPLHHRNNGSSNGDFSSAAPRNTGRRKRIRRSRNKPIRCCGVPIDVPVVGVVTILFLGMILLTIGSTSLLHGSTGDDTSSHRNRPFQHHFEQDPNHRHAQERGRHHENLEEESRRLHQKSPPSSGHGNRETAEEPYAMNLPSSPIRVIYENNKNKNSMNDIYDVVIAGAGPSGLTAALFASRAGLKVHVLGSASTGLLSQTKRLDNFPSFVGGNGNTLSGPDWVEATLAQAKSWGASFGPPGLFATSMERQRIALSGHDQEENDVFFSLTTADKTEIRGWSVIVASGATPRTLGLPGEDKLWGVSLHNCAICDGHLYQGTEKVPTTVLVVGGGDAALDAALLLARYATKVILVHRREEFSSAHNLASLNAVRSTSNIEVLTPFVVNKWITKNDDPSQLVGAELLPPATSATESKKRHVDIDGAFVMIGATPNTKWMKNVGIALDEEELIQTTAKLHTPAHQIPSSSMITASSVPGLFAAGEVTDNIYKQAITAAAAGAQAAIDAERWLREQRGVNGMTSSNAGSGNHVGAASTSERKLEPVSIEVDETSDHGDTQSDNYSYGVDKCDLVSADCVRSIVGAYPVVVFSKPWCPFCRKAMEALSRAGLSEQSDKLLVIDLSKHSNSQDIQSTLQKMTGRRTVPNVFVGGKSIGGGDETHAFQQSGKLVPMLVEAGALGDHNDAEKAEKQRKMQQDKKEAVETKNKPPTTRHSSSESESCDLSSEECIREIVNKYPILLFSLSWCPECKQTLQLLSRMGIDDHEIHIIDLDDYKEVALNIRAHMKTLSGRRSVPNLFVGGENFGGFQKTFELRETGELAAKFAAVGAKQFV